MNEFLPGSFYEEEKNQYEAHILYELEAGLVSLDNHVPDILFAQEFVVRELLKENIATIKGEMTVAIVNCCCIDKGVSKITSSFDKNAYAPGE